MLAFHMKHHGLSFLEAAEALGALTKTGSSKSKAASAPRPFSARDALGSLRFEALLCAVAACNLARGVLLTDVDRARLVESAGRIERVAREVSP